MDSATRARELTKAISHTSLRKKLHWYPPRKGINPAYDMALEFLHRDRENKKAAIERIEKRIARVKNGIFNPLVKITIDGGNAERLTELENARYQLMILRDINAPEVRWRFKQGDIDLRLATHQYLYRQNWESGQYYGKLMQRLETMKIIPDSLPTLKPKVDFRLRFWEKKYPSRVRRRTNGWRDTEAGELLPSASLMKPPRMEIIPHHREWWLPKKYTVVMLDLGMFRIVMVLI
jgi:large subunit ribosomal protein L35